VTSYGGVLACNKGNVSLLATNATLQWFVGRGSLVSSLVTSACRRSPGRARGTKMTKPSSVLQTPCTHQFSLHC